MRSGWLWTSWWQKWQSPQDGAIEMMQPGTSWDHSEMPRVRFPEQVICLAWPESLAWGRWGVLLDYLPELRAMGEDRYPENIWVGIEALLVGTQMSALWVCWGEVEPEMCVCVCVCECVCVRVWGHILWKLSMSAFWARCQIKIFF